jgi:hypothetical protein
MNEPDSEKKKGNPRFTEGEGWLAWKRVPLKVKGSVIDPQLLENYKRKTSLGDPGALKWSK